jgi:hypothetical protein
MKFELTNQQREYLGLEPIKSDWDKVILKADTYRPESIIYFEGDTLKRHIVSYDNIYKETQYDELTKDRRLLLPKTAKGKEKTLTGSVLESRQPIGVYLFVDNVGNFLIGNHTTQKTFYSSQWDKQYANRETDVSVIIETFISESTGNHLNEIREFKNAKRQHIKFKSGDFFAFKVNRTEYGFGRVLLNVDLLRKKKLMPGNHGLYYLMGPPVLVMIYAHISESKLVDINALVKAPTLPTDFIMDNMLLYGEFEIIGHRELEEDEFDFPMSYGRNLDRQVPEVFLQWGLIHIEKPLSIFSRYLEGENKSIPTDNPSRKVQNPYGYYSIGFRPRYNTLDIKETISRGQFDFDNNSHYSTQFDLRNPKNLKIRNKIMKEFGLNPNGNYEENRELTGTIKTTEILNRLEKQ